MIDDFLLRALLAGVGVALAAGPLGCFVVWRRMSYFGATLAHAALLGIALGFLLGVAPLVGVIAVCIAVALILVGLDGQRLLPTDSLLGILAHGTLAAGMIVVGFVDGLRIDLMAYLFGDVLAVTMSDLGLIYGLSAVSLGVLVWIWRPLLSSTVHGDLARTEGVAVDRVRIIFMLLLALVIAVGMKIVGILLIISLLIIPAATARHVAKTPEQMALLAAAIGCICVALGIEGSMTWDVPAGPAIVVVATLAFLGAFLVRLIGSQTRSAKPARLR